MRAEAQVFFVHGSTAPYFELTLSQIGVDPQDVAWLVSGVRLLDDEENRTRMNLAGDRFDDGARLHVPDHLRVLIGLGADDGICLRIPSPVRTTLEGARVFVNVHGRR